MEEVLTHQCDYGALSCELGSTEQRADKPVDLFLLRVLPVVVERHLGFLEDGSGGGEREDGEPWREAKGKG